MLLPAGTALPFGSMIRQLKRSQMLEDVTKVGSSHTAAATPVLLFASATPVTESVVPQCQGAWPLQMIRLCLFVGAQYTGKLLCAAACCGVLRCAVLCRGVRPGSSGCTLMSTWRQMQQSWSTLRRPSAYRRSTTRHCTSETSPSSSSSSTAPGTACQQQLSSQQQALLLPWHKQLQQMAGLKMLLLLPLLLATLDCGPTPALLQCLGCSCPHWLASTLS